MPGYFGVYEFSVVPKSLFTPDVNLHKCTDIGNVADDICNPQASVMLGYAILNRESNDANKVMTFGGV